MKKTSLNIVVETVEGVIHITRPDPMQNQDDCIEVSRDQVDQLIDWLKEAKTEIQSATKKSA